MESTIRTKWNRVKDKVRPLKFRKFRAISLIRGSAVIREIPSILNSRFNHARMHRHHHHHHYYRPLCYLPFFHFIFFSSLASLSIEIDRSRVFAIERTKKTRYRCERERRTSTVNRTKTLRQIKKYGSNPTFYTLARNYT